MKVSQLNNLAQRANKANTVQACTEWWCQIIRDFSTQNTKLLYCYIKSMQEKYYKLLFRECGAEVGKIKQTVAWEIRQIIYKYGYENPSQFMKEVFEFQKEVYGNTFNYKIFNFGG